MKSDSCRYVGMSNKRRWHRLPLVLGGQGRTDAECAHNAQMFFIMALIAIFGLVAIWLYSL